jgi:hypothetical protein
MSTGDSLISRRWLGRLALGGAAALLVVVAILLPIAAHSMWTELIRREEPQQYDFLSGTPVIFSDDDVARPDVSYVNIVVTGIDAATQIATLDVSGNLSCADPCPALEFNLTLYSLADAGRRRGLPPSTTLDLSPATDGRVFSETVELPVHGNPSLYPFDDYQLWLGMQSTATMPDGTVSQITLKDIENIAVFTLQSRAGDLDMQPPIRIDPRSVHAVTDPFEFLTVQRLDFERPAYQHVLAVLLVLLISVSAVLALFMRTINELLLGIGGLILGIWGVRSVVVPSAPSHINVVDLALAFVILVLLVALSLRVAHHVYRLNQGTSPTVTTETAGDTGTETPTR